MPLWYTTRGEIAGIGARRKRALLHHLGSAQAVEGISKAVAQRIYDHFRGAG